jgi:AbrB family looped-hinge helix DNA binding protein
VRITSKGQVTIPQAIRERAGLLPGSEVRFVERNGRVWLEPAHAAGTRGQRLVSALRGSLRKHTRLTTDQLMLLTRGGVG